MIQIDDRTMRVLDEKEMQRYGMPAIPAPGVKNTKKAGMSSAGKAIALGSLGVVAGICGAAGINAFTPAQRLNEEDLVLPGDESSEGDSATAGGNSDQGSGQQPSNNVHTQGHNIEIPLMQDISLAVSPNDSMSFNQAFASARAEVGAHGVFEWRSGVYGTYYADEWASLPEDYRREFTSHNWEPLCATGHNDLELDWTPQSPMVGNDVAGRTVIVLQDAFTGNPVYYYPDGSVTPIIDDYGQVVGMVDTASIEAASDDSDILLGLDGNVYITDDPETFMIDQLIMALDDDTLLAEMAAPEVVGEYDESLVSVLNADDIDFENDSDVALVDEDPAVVDFGDEDIVAEVVDFDGMPEAQMTPISSDYVSCEADAVSMFPDQIDDPMDTAPTFDDYSV